MRYNKNIKADFVEVMRSVSKVVDTSKIRQKYLDWNWLFERFYPIICKLKKHECKTCIDFGCGTGGLVVLANLMGIETVGIDIPIHSNGANQYCNFTSELTRIGFTVKVFDTSKYPWDLKNDSIDSVTAFQSLREDYTDNTQPAHLSWNHDVIVKRVKEISRIIRQKGFWYVGSVLNYKGLKKSQVWGSLSAKKYKLKLWGGSGVKGRQ